MTTELKVLMIEDVATDAGLITRELKKAGIEHEMARVETKPEFLRTLEAFVPDIILSDFSMPHFDGLTALELAREKAPDTPFIFVSGTIGEETAIESLKRGATDHILKNNLARLGPAVMRALQDVEERQARLSIERQLDEARIRFELFMRYLPGGAFIKDPQGRYQFVNWSWEEIRGRKMAEVLGRTDGNLWPELAAQFESNDRLVIDRNDALRSIETFPRPDGVHHYLVQKFPIRDHGGRPVLVGGISIDYTDRLRAEEKITRLSRIQAVLSGINSLIVRVRDRQELFNEACRIAVEHGGFGIAWIGTFNPETKEIIPVAWGGLDSESLTKSPNTGKDLVGRAIREKRAVFSNDITVNSEQAGVRRQEAIRRGYRSFVSLPLLVEGAAVGTLSLFAKETNFFTEDELKLLNELAGDISFALEHIGKEEQLNYLAYYDALTALPNRTLFCDRVNQFAHAHQEGEDSMAVLTLNLERFANVNETFGRQAGDALLKLIAERLQQAIGNAGALSRIGGDTFVVSLMEVREVADVAHILEAEIISALSRPFTVEGQELRLSFKCGIALFPGDGGDAESLLRNAEAALKKVKDSGEKYLFYAPQMNARVAEILSLENKLRVAISNKEFVLHYQPIVNLVSNHVVGLEALIRWNSPESGLVPPLKFIPILEETGMILEVGMWVLRQALVDQQRWRRQGLISPRIAVNISSLQLRHKGFVDEVSKMIAEEKNNPVEIDFEITESVIMEDLDQYIPKLRAIRTMGIGIEIDDFGTGYSSLGYIAKLPVSALKIDRSFVDDMTKGDDSMTIVSTIISLAHALNLHVVAEGVETEAQRDLLKMLKCDEMQGYLFCKPLPAAEIETLFGA